MIAEHLKYKQTGIEWIPQVPEHWRLWKVSRAFKTIGSGTTPESGNSSFYEDGTINWINTGDLNDGVLESCEKRITQKAFVEHSTLKIYTKGTLLIAMYGATIGKVALMNIEGCTNQACCALSESEVLLNEFAFYWFVCNKQNIVRLSYGGGQPNISQDVIKQLRIPTPPKEEQDEIVQHIKAQEDKINQFIQKKKRFIELLKEQRQSIITNAITKGVDVNVKLKQSGVEWLGDVPENWEVRRMQYLAKINNGIDCEKQFEGTYPVYGSGGIFGWTENYLYDKPSVLLGRKGTIDKPIFVSEPFWTVDTAFYTEINEELVTPIFFYHLCCLIPFGFYGTKTALPSMTQTSLYGVKLPIPPLEEQKQIVSHIKTETATIDTAIAKAEREIELIKEYKEAMISEAVMGTKKINNE